MSFLKPKARNEKLVADEIRRMQIEKANRAAERGKSTGIYDPYDLSGMYSYPPSPPGPLEPKDPVESESLRYKMLCMRLRITEGQKMPFQQLNTALAGDKVFVFVVNRDEAVILEDARDLFPSDDLVTQLRLIA
jgi:hypothetical protein